MEYRVLTGTGLEVSTLCLGAMLYGGQVAEKDAVEMVHYALDCGVNFVDTANVYVTGESETVLGKALKGRRDKIILATKVGSYFGKGPNEHGLSRRHVLEQLDGSLRRLGTDYIDIYYMHRPDPNTPVQEIIQTLDIIVRSGKVRYIGASNFAAWQLCELYYEAARHGSPAPVVTQMVYNAVTRGIEQELIPFLDKFDTGLVTYNPLAGGMLTGKYSEKNIESGGRFKLNAGYKNRYWNEENFSAVEKLSGIAKALGISLVELSMRWVYTNSAVDCILVGASSLKQLAENLTSIDAGALPKDALAEFDAVWDEIKGNRFAYNRER